MSEARAATAPGGAPAGAARSPQAGRRDWLAPVNVIIIVVTLLAVALRLYYLYTRPGGLMGVNEYDDGPYFGSAVRLVHGVLPYRDFVLVQPPGITLLMSPVAALTYLTGTGWGLAIGRVATMLASSAGVALGGLLVRHRGPVAVIGTCGILAVYPTSIAAAHTVLVEPWLVLFCLIGAVAVFDRDHLAGARRLAWGGVAFGFAGAVEGWAIVPVLLIALMCLPDLRRLARFAGGVIAGFAVPVLPFAILAPGQFYRSLITAQVGYRANAYRVTLWTRLENMAGLLISHGWTHAIIMLSVVAIVIFVAGGQFAAWLLARRIAPPLEWFAMLTAVIVAFMFLWPPQFHYHFTAFLAPFLALSIGLTAASVTAAAQLRARRASAAGMPPGYAANGAAVRAPAPGGVARWIMPGATAVAALAIAVMAYSQAGAERATPEVVGPIPAATVALLPPGACVFTDQVSVTIAANRFASGVPGCPQMVDSLGTDLALSNGLKPGTGAGAVPAVASFWLHAFEHSQYILLTADNARRVPWIPALLRYLRTDFTVVPQPSRHLTLYARRGLPR